MRDNVGYTEQAGEKPLVYDPSDARLPVLPGAGDDTRTVTIHEGVESVRATAYGNPVAYTPEDRAARAFDGDLYTAWKVGAFANVRNERIVATLDRPITTDRVQLWQVQHGPKDRWITKVTLRFDGGPPVVARLGDASRGRGGRSSASRGGRSASSRSPSTTPTSASTATTAPPARWLRGDPLRDDRPGARPVRVDEVERMPTDLLDAAGPGRWSAAWCSWSTVSVWRPTRPATTPSCRSRGASTCPPHGRSPCGVPCGSTPTATSTAPSPIAPSTRAPGGISATEAEHIRATSRRGRLRPSTATRRRRS